LDGIDNIPSKHWDITVSGHEPNLDGAFTVPAQSSVEMIIYVPENETVGPHSMQFSFEGVGSSSLGVVVTAAPANGFRITANPATVSVNAGFSGGTTLTLTATGDFTGPVNLSAGALVQGMMVTFQPATVTVPLHGSITSTMTVSAPTGVTSQNTQVAVTGTNGEKHANVSVPLAVIGTGGGGGGVGGVVFLSDAARTLRIPDLTAAGFTDTGTQVQGTGGSNIYVAADETVYLADRNHHRIVQFKGFASPVITMVGSQGSGTLQFNAPNGVWVGPDNKIYVADTNNNRIVRMDDMTGAGFAEWHPTGSTLNKPDAVFVDSSGAMYVADTFNFRILRANSFADTIFQAIGTYGPGIGHMLLPHGIFVRNGRIYVADEHRIIAMDNITGVGWTEINDNNAGVGVLQSPRAIFVQANGRITIADSGKKQVISFAAMDASGKTVWPPASATFTMEAPRGVFIR
jgi:hypothetical protein